VRIATLLGLLLTLTVAAPAHAATRRAFFKVEVKGVQTTSWSIDRTTPGPCGGHAQGSGSERMTFKTARPVRTTVSLSQGLLTFTFGRSTSLTAQGVANRQGSTSNTPNPGECAGGGTGGGPAQPTPDCGRRSGPIDLEIAKSYRRRDWIVLTNGPLSPLTIYKHCPIGGAAWPDVIETDTAGRPIEAPMPVRDLFNPALRKHLTIGRGSQSVNASGQKATTSVRWEITFTRI
jgi:hypothetical protein